MERTAALRYRVAMDCLSIIQRRAIEVAGNQPMLDQVVGWSEVNSGTRNLTGLATMFGMLADAFSVLPGTVVATEPAPVTAIGRDGAAIEIAHGKHLRQTIRPGAPVQLLLTGHMDTVYPADHPLQQVRRDGGVLRGPGVADMKSGLAVMLAALVAIEDSPARNRLGYTVLINSDEETGSLSSAALIAALAPGRHAALTYEPALPDGTLAGARGGSGNFAFVVRGRSAHAGRNPEEGRNAIVAAADLALRLQDLADASLSVNPARIDGGGPNNVVPDQAVLRVNFRPRTSEAAALAEARIRQIAHDVSCCHDVAVEVTGGFNRPPKPIDAGTAALFDLVARSGDDLGLTIGWHATGGVCDGNNIAACGVPAVDTMGARGGAIHSPEEYLVIDSLAERAALSALTIIRIVDGGLGGGEVS